MVSQQDMEQRIVRYGDLVPCRTAFIDAHTPGSDQKENFTIIGGGVSESADQHVHIKDTPGFNIGSADMLLTNFHLPKSTLLMLVSAFSGYDFMMKTYELAVSNNYRFFSYGDACLIERGAK